MKKTIVLFLILFPLLEVSAKKPVDVSIALPSTGYGGSLADLSYYFGEDWCDFYQDSQTGEYYLHKTTFDVSVSYDECSEDTTVWVRSQRPNSLFIINGLEPKRKPVKTLALSVGEGVKVGGKYSFNFGKTTYTLRAEGTSGIGYHDEYWHKIKDYKLYLSDGKNEQLITTVSEFYSTSPEILWIGDLDGDGKPDFAVRTATWYEDEKIELYLSLIAGNGELVKLADTAEYFRQC